MVEHGPAVRRGLIGIICGGAILLAGCASAPDGGQNPASHEVDAAECALKGGEVRRAGMLGQYRCIIPYTDAGALCRDSGECEGRCKGDDSVTNYDAEPGAAKGKCEVNDSPFGCYSLIEDGTPTPFLCVD